jgi:PhnB protein
VILAGFDTEVEMAVKPIPDGYRTVTPYLIVQGVDEVLDFMQQAFAAEEKVRMTDEKGSTNHAEFRIGDSLVMVGEASERWSPMPGVIHLYVEDCDAIYRRAVEAGGTSVQEPEDQFYGDRMAGVRDVAGNMWWIATHVEDVPPEEMAKRAAQQGS